MHPLVGEWLESPGALIRLKGHSMWPLYRDGEVVEVEPAALESLHVGDVVVMKLEKHLRVHRLVGQGPRGMRTAGDALRAPDPWQEPSSCVGRVKTPAGWRCALDGMLRVLTPLRTRWLP